MNISSSVAQAIADVADAELYEDYSGRGMYGRTCLGFATSNQAALGRAIGRELPEDEAEQLLDHMHTDSLGLRTIVYFPGVRLDDEDED